MALKGTIVKKSREDGQFDPQRVVYATLAFDSSYPAGGETLILSEVGLASIDQLIIPSMKGYTFEWTGSKVKAFVQTDPADAGGADIALVEVTAAVDLSALTAVPCIIIGDEA